MPVVMRADGASRGITVVRARMNSKSDAANKNAAAPKAMRPGRTAGPHGAASGMSQVMPKAAAVQTGGKSIHFIMTTSLAVLRNRRYGLLS